MGAVLDILSRYGFYAMAALGIAISFLASGIETGAYRLNRIRLRLRADAGDRRARTLLRLLGDLPGFIITILIVNNVGNYMVTAAVTSLVAAWMTAGDLELQLTATAIVTPVLYVFCEVLPKNVFAFAPGEPMCRLAHSIRGVYMALKLVGLVPALKGVSALVLRIAHGGNGGGPNPFHPRQRLRAFLREGAAEGVITGYQNELVEKVLGLRERRVRQVMIPLRDVTAVPAGIDRDRFIDRLRQHSYSRLPVWESHKDRIVGIVHIRDVLGAEYGTVVPRAVMATDVVRLKPGASVSQALYRLQGRRAPMAVVEDDKGRALGIVTVKDLVEEIVGELPVW